MFRSVGEVDKRAKVGDCHFLLLVKLPSGNVHRVMIDHGELKEFMLRRNNFKVFENVIDNLTFTPYYEKNNSNNK